MPHYYEARDRTQSWFCSPSPVRDRIKRGLLMWDLEARLRVLVEPADGEDASALRTDLSAQLSADAAPFWTGEVWLWTPDVARDHPRQALYESAWRAGQDCVVAEGPEIRVLQRHVAREAWFNPQVREPWPLNKHTPPIVSFYSFKGGVGRTTAVIAMAMHLARRKQRVVLIDLDLEAPGLSALLPPTAGNVLLGAADYLLERPLASAVFPVDIADYSYQVDDERLVEGGYPIRVIPAGRLDEQYLSKIALLDYRRLVQPAEGGESPIIELLTDAKARLQAEYILVDSRSGLHDLGGLALSAMTHLDVLFSTSSEQSWEGLALTTRFLGADRLMAGLDQLDFALVYALAPSNVREGEPSPLGVFRDRAHDLLGTTYYADNSARPMPQADATDEPHNPVPVRFDSELLAPGPLAGKSAQLMGEDYEGMVRVLLSRLGRNYDEIPDE